jgi:hypothetical protein
VFSARTTCLVALALAATTGPAAAQININVNVGRRPPAVAVPPIGSIHGHRPRRPWARPPVGVVTLPDRVPVRPVPPSAP